MALTYHQWIERFSKAVDLPAPTEEEVTQLLDLAGAAAHSSERQAAPVTCWIAARAALSPAEALEIAEGIRSGLEAGARSDD